MVSRTGYVDQVFASLKSLRDDPELWDSQIFPQILDKQGDVYCSIATRTKRVGTASAVGVGLSAWADMDNEDAVYAFSISPSAVVQTSPPRRKYHAYWFLDEPPANMQLLLRINRSIPNADLNAIDKARVLRAPGFSNMKYASLPVAKLVRLEADLRYSMEALATAFPPREATPPRHSRAHDDAVPSWLGLVFDALTDFLELGGYRPRSRGANGGVMALCPLHHDTNQSLSIHPTRGYHCFGCKAGGKLTDLAHKLNVRVGQ